MKFKYKVWIHLEEIEINEKGEELNYKSIDEEFLPLPVAETKTIERAIGVMEEINANYWDKAYWNSQTD